MGTFLCSPASRCLPVTKLKANLMLLIKLPGESQYSACSGVTAMTRMFGSLGLSHHNLAGIDQSSSILLRSALIFADPDMETYFCRPGSANARHTFGNWRISSSL